MHGRIVDIRHDSQALHGNPLGDPTERSVLAYLPPGHGEGAARFPLVVILPGFAANHRSIVGWDPFQPNTVERFDAQLARGETKPAILLLPDCTNRWGGSQFLDSSATGPYQRYLAEELLPFADATFRTVPEREARAIVGRSSGGFGALRFAMDRPDLVAAVGSHAGDADFEVSLRPMLTAAATAIAKAGGLEAFAARVVEGGPRGDAEFSALFLLAASAAYAPEAAGPLPRCALPVDLDTGALRPEVWARFLAQDPCTLTEARVAALRQMRTIFLDAGDADEHGLHFAARRLHRRFTAEGLPSHHEEFEGGHRGTSHRYARSLPLLIDALC